MEPLDPTKNAESSGFSRRRISSILKAPRQSMRFPEPEQEENVVECIKPVEKRTSRRVSFAPANNVLLFSNDVKNISPVRSPLQDFMTTTATQNRVQDTEDGSQHITGMETLLNAPLHTSQQREQANCDAENAFGEKTVMFSTDDAFMDMTHSQTINIGSDADLFSDLSLRSCDIFPSGREKNMLFTTSDGAMAATLGNTVNITSGCLSTNKSKSLNSDIRSISSTVPSLDLGFENFIASVFKPSGGINPDVPRTGTPSENKHRSLVQIKTQQDDMDKENQAPVSVVMEGSLNTSRKCDQSSYGTVFCPVSDKSMDITEAVAGSIQTSPDDVGSSAHSQGMFPQFDHRVSQTAEKTNQQQSRMMKASLRPNEKTTLKNPRHSSHHKVSLERADEYRQKTIMFSAGDDMDMAQCHTVSIASGSLAHPNQNHTCGKMESGSSLKEREHDMCGLVAPSVNGLDLGFKDFLTGLSKRNAPAGNAEIVRMVPSAAACSVETHKPNNFLSGLEGKEQLNSTLSFGDVSMDMTEALMGHMEAWGNGDMYPNCESVKMAQMTLQQKSSKAHGSTNSAGTEALFKTSLKKKIRCDADDESRDKTVRFSAHDTRMAGTQSHTVSFATNFAADDLRAELGHLQKVQMNFNKQQNSEAVGLSIYKGLEPSMAALKTNMEGCQVKSDDNRDKTVRFTADEACMDVTRSHTVNIVSDLEMHSLQNMHFLPSCGEKTVRFTANEAAMDMTQSLTVNIASGVDPQTNPDMNILPTCGEKTVRFTANDAAMDMTQSLTVNIASGVDTQTNPDMDILPTCGEKTVRFTANDAAMDMTQSLTVNIASGVDPQTNPDMDILPTCGEKTMRFSANEAAMDVTRCHTVNIASGVDPQTNPDMHILPACGEKTLRFSANEAAMDVSRCHTVNIASGVGTQTKPDTHILPTYGEKTMRFSANEAAMDVTRCLTVNIASGVDPQTNPDMHILPTCGEKTLRFSANEAAMDVTRCHTVNIASGVDPQTNPDMHILPACGEKTLRFSANDAAMDVTRCHTVSTAGDIDLHSHQNVDYLPSCGERTVRVTADDAVMDVTLSPTVNIAAVLNSQSHQSTEFVPVGGEKMVMVTKGGATMNEKQSHTVNIPCDPVTHSVLPHRDCNILSPPENVDVPSSVKKRESEICPDRNQSSSPHTLDPRFENPLSNLRTPWIIPVIAKTVPGTLPPNETIDTDGFLDQFSMKRHVDTEKETSRLGSATTKKPVNQTTAECLEDDMRAAMTEDQTDHMLDRTCAVAPPQNTSSTQDLDSGNSCETQLTSQKNNGSPNSDFEEITNLKSSLDANQTENMEEHKPQKQTSPMSADRVDAALSRRSRRMSFADLHTKIRRLSHMINTAPDSVAPDSCTASLPQQEHDMDKDPKEKPVKDPAAQEDTQDQGCMDAEPISSLSTTPFKLQTKQLMSRLSVGGFKPKLPQRSKPNDSKVNSAREHMDTLTVNVTNQLSDFDADVSDIYDEELGSCEDMSEVLNTRSCHKAKDNVSPPQGVYLHGPLENDVFEEESIRAGHGRKRLLPVDENNVEDEKRAKASSEIETGFDTHSESHLIECGANMTSAPNVTHTTDESSSSHTASIRCEATFESTFKHSLFESQLEDYASDMQRRFDDGSITVLEFFKLFNIDFVIHNPRQSVLPERRLSDTDRTPLDLLKDRHIQRPKHVVYETDVLKLTETVEGLKERMRDLDKPLVVVNRSLWEEMRSSSEKELKCFGAKLKERNNLFRKMSKVQSHEMKETLYSNLLQADLAEQQRLRKTIAEADEMLQSLDDCVCELEAELAAVEEKGCEDSPGLTSLQEEMKNATEALADKERQISELETQTKQNSRKLKRLKAETKILESHIAAVNLINEWKFGETSGGRTVFTFLHETFHLLLLYEDCNGNAADNQLERKISHITFQHQIDEEKSQDHACLVHKLLSQYTEGQSSWVEKYPTDRHVPKLLHDVGLVVGHCRLLGEELRLLKMWGGLRFDVLHISCEETRVHIVFSSLKKFSKFEVIFSVGVSDHLYVLHVQSFTNRIGTTTIQEIEKIVTSLSPGRNLLTKTVKNIHYNLLC